MQALAKVENFAYTQMQHYWSSCQADKLKLCACLSLGLCFTARFASSALLDFCSFVLCNRRCDMMHMTCVWLVGKRQLSTSKASTMKFWKALCSRLSVGL